MLKKLYIRNYALISELEMEFDRGLTIISGETGAGKSILLGAMSMVLGQRADTGVLADKTSKCIVEGSFDIGGHSLESYFSNNDLDHERICSIRREINIAGKSRAFVNDTPVNLNVLRELGHRLVDVHSQHNNILLSDNAFQLGVVDAWASNAELLAAYREEYTGYSACLKRYNELNESSEKAGSELDYMQFQLDQLEEASLRTGEQEEAEEELELLDHAEEIALALGDSHRLINADDKGVIQAVRELRRNMERIVPFFKAAAELNSRLESMDIELSDINSEIENLASRVENDPSRLDYLRERINLIYSLEKKHRVDTVEELIGIRDDLRDSVGKIENLDEELEKAAAELELARDSVKKAAGLLSSARKASFGAMEEKVVGLLQKLGIPNASFVVEMTGLPEPGPAGGDHIDYMFSANKNGELQELKKVASGGELSRLMLSLKSLITESNSMPTIIFDEIDTGVSGDIADRMGEIIHSMSDGMQVVNITHLPQIASKGNRHYRVFKSDEDDRTHTRIKLLAKEERLMEIARMLSGREMSEAAIENARVLLSGGNQ